MKNKKRVEIKCFNNHNYASNAVVVKNFYNFLPTEYLNNSMGVKVASFPILENVGSKEIELNLSGAGIMSVNGVAYFKQYFPESGISTHRLLIYGDDKKLYINELFCEDRELYWLYNLTFNQAPITLSFKKDDNDVIILADKEQMKIWKTNSSPYSISNVPIITSMCMNEGVLYCTIQEPAFKIWYTSDLNAEHIGDATTISGFISLEDELGYARKILTFDENVYVFRDYGISKITKFQKSFSVSQIYLSNTLIYSNTVSLCGNLIFFMTKTGLYSFNGVKVSRVNESICELLNEDNSNAVGASLGNKYYLALNLKFDDGKKILCEENNCVNNSVIIYDIYNNSYEIIRGLDIKSLLPVKTECFEKMLCTFNTVHNDKLGEFVNDSKSFDDNLPKLWFCDFLLDNFNDKMVTKLTVVADVNIKFKLIYDNKEISFTSYKSGLNEFCFKIYAKIIKLEISSNEESAVVKNIYLDYYIKQ